MQAGDLIWPKKPGGIVPYNSSPGEADKSDAVRWRKEKQAYLDRISRKASLSPKEKERYSALQKMDYEEFVSSYLAEATYAVSSRLIGNAVSVGHVGIIEITDGIPFVVEAMVGIGVRRLSYADWLRDRPGELVWVGRLKNVSDKKRAAVAKSAAEQMGKPYDFWGFDLEDVSWFLLLKAGVVVHPSRRWVPARWQCKSQECFGIHQSSTASFEQEQSRCGTRRGTT